MEKERKHGLMVEFSKASGQIIKCMAKERFNGLMVVNTMVSTTTTKKMAMESSTGLMVASMTGIGKMVNRRASEFTKTHPGK